MELNEFLVLEIKQVSCTVFVVRYSKLRGIKPEVFFRFSVGISLIMSLQGFFSLIAQKGGFPCGISGLHLI